jgi:hypothetical protein
LIKALGALNSTITQNKTEDKPAPQNSTPLYKSPPSSAAKDTTAQTSAYSGKINYMEEALLNHERLSNKLHSSKR